MLRPMTDDATSLFDDAHRRTARWLMAWDAQGIHRTGTAGDDAGAQWLAAEAAALGGDVSIEEFALDRPDPIAAYPGIGAPPVAAVAALHAPATGAARAHGPL